MTNTFPMKLKLGELLLNKGVISPQQLSIALGEQKKRGKRLGEVLIELNYVKDTDLCDILANQFGYERYGVHHAFDPTASELIPVEMSKRIKVIPLNQVDSNKLEAVLTDPMNFQGIDMVESATGMLVHPLLCTSDEFEQLLSAVYGRTQELSSSSFSTLSGPEFTQEEDLVTEAEDLQLTTVQSMSEDAPVIHTVNWIITDAIQKGASDIHISPEKNHIQLRFRIDGQLLEVPPPPRKMLLPIVSRIKVLSKMDIAHSMIPQDGRFTVKVKNREINIRVSTIPTINGENMVLRLLDSSSGLKRLDQLGMSAKTMAILETAINNPYGMILATGPTGSGKSTTLYSILTKLSRPELNIVTVEDPAEHRLQNIRQVQLNEKMGMTFSSALRSILRQDPDIVMVGEIRDSETAVIAARAALTGHMVLSTLHTNNAISAIERLKDMEVPAFIIAATLTACIAQRLIRTICEECKEEGELPQEMKTMLNLPDNVTYYKATGCHSCRNTGYKGRTGIYELLTVNKAIKSLISQNAENSVIEAKAVETSALLTFKTAAEEKLTTGATTPEEVLSALMV